MIIGLFVILCIVGIFFFGFDIFLPLPLPFVLVFSMRIMGLVFLLMAIMVILARLYQTNFQGLVDLAKEKQVTLIHQRRGKHPNAKILYGKLEDLEHIRTKNKIFKDTGGGFRLAGHDVRRTHETICHDIPEWLGQYWHQIKQKYGVSNLKERDALYKKLKDLKKPAPGMTIEDQLNLIPELNPIMQNDEKKQHLLDMSLQDLQNMAELLYDGQIIHMEEVEEFIDSATPNELDSYITQNVAHKFLRFKAYAEPGQVNWAMWVPILVVLFIGAAIAFQIIAGGR